MTNTFLSEGDRTIDQMVQSARTEKLQQDFQQNGGIKEQMIMQESITVNKKITLY